MEKRFTLAKFRLLDVPEDQDHWMYQDPSVDNVIIAKDVSDKIGEIRESAVSRIQ